MRRIVGILALLGAVLVATVGTALPASAHPAIEDPSMPVQVTTTVAFGAPSEEPGSLVGVGVVMRGLRVRTS